MQKLVALLVLLGISGISFANNCENPRNTYDEVYCLNKVFASADRELNQNYQKLRGHLNQRQKNILKTAQLSWIRERDARCSDDEIQTVYVRCNLSETTSRNAWLRERIRECQTIGCQTQKLYDD